MEPTVADPLAVLAADDDRDILDLVRFVLTRAGHEVTGVSDGAAALELALERPFDVAVLDVRMPNLSGYEVTRCLRERDERLPVMLLSASVQDDQIAQGFGAGADDYIRKPFSPREFVGRVEALASR